MSTQLGDIHAKADARKARCEARPEREARTALLFHSIAENLANLLFGAAAMPPGTTLKTSLHVIIQLPHDQLCHDTDDITISDLVLDLARWAASATHALLQNKYEITIRPSPARRT